ncbi:MAG TPA: translation initiation factor IF-3 [Blastocatellia bacterium]|nr:translation initiation factor IF-3 [Blastocatellia bacterium]
MLISSFQSRRGFRDKRDRGPSVRVNERIRVREIRVIDDDGSQLGIMSPQQALEIARSKGLDLVEVAPQAQPPVCRIINFGKWQYEQKKKAKEAKSKQTFITVKEIKFRPGTDEHDYTFKKNNAIRILHEGDKVKATVHFRGREITHKELGQALLQRLEKELADVAVVEARPKLEGMNMFIILAPKKK